MHLLRDVLNHALLILWLHLQGRIPQFARRERRAVVRAGLQVRCHDFLLFSEKALADRLQDLK